MLFILSFKWENTFQRYKSKPNQSAATGRSLLYKQGLLVFWQRQYIQLHEPHL